MCVCLCRGTLKFICTHTGMALRTLRAYTRLRMMTIPYFLAKSKKLELKLHAHYVLHAFMYTLLIISASLSRRVNLSTI